MFVRSLPPRLTTRSGQVSSRRRRRRKTVVEGAVRPRPILLLPPMLRQQLCPWSARQSSQVRDSQARSIRSAGRSLGRAPFLEAGVMGIPGRYSTEARERAVAAQHPPRAQAAAREATNSRAVRAISCPGSHASEPSAPLAGAGGFAFGNLYASCPLTINRSHCCLRVG